MIRALLLAGLALLALLAIAVPATAAPADDSGINATALAEAASEGANWSEAEAEAAFEWFTSHQSEFSPSERGAIRNWLTEQMTGQASEARESAASADETPADATRFHDFTGEDSDETETYDAARSAVEDGEVRESELPDVFEYRGEQIFPNLRLEYEEWDGDQTTLILVAEESMEISMNDAWLASAETDRPAPRYHVSLKEGLNVVQLPTVEDTSGEEYVAISSSEYVETISNPFQPFIERVSKRHIPSVAGGSISGFVVLFVLFASFRKNRYRGRLVHLAEVLRMR